MGMKYPNMTLPDDTEITHGNIREDGSVLEYIETPVDWGFNSACCVLPSYEWSDIRKKPDGCGYPPAMPATYTSAMENTFDATKFF